MNPSKFSLPPGKAWKAGAGMLATALALQLAARCLTGFGQWYSVHVYRWIVEILGRLTGLVPFSLGEMFLYALILICLVFFIRNLKRPGVLLSRAFCLVSALALVFTTNCGVNYYRGTFAQESGLNIQSSSLDELYDLCSFLAEQIRLSLQDLESQGAYEPQLTQEPGLSLAQLNQMGRAGQQAMARLGEEFPQLSGYYPLPKPILVSWFLSIQQICGIYSPFTVEANYNRDMPRYNIPHTLCHELSHLKGFMREDEANFIGYMACAGSEDPFFRYSGYLTGWVYAGNALGRQDPEAYLALRKTLPWQALQDLSYNNTYWENFNGKAAQVSTQINDTYLKIQDQSDGVQSYGRMVDLMLAWYRQKQAS